MAPKRQTLDGMKHIGTRIRPRTYADSYVPKPISRGQMDIIAPAAIRVPVFEPEVIAIEKAKQILTPMQPKPVNMPVTKVVTTANKVVRPQFNNKPEPASTSPKITSLNSEPKVDQIHDIVRDIQKVEESRSDRLMIAEDGSVVEISGLSHRLSATFQNMFASKRSIAMSAMSMLLFVGGMVALASSFTTNRVVGSQVKALSDKASINESLGATDSDSGVPSEEEVPEAVVNTYKPPADEPRYVYIPKLKNAKTRVLKMNVGKDNAVQTPRTTWDTGWYAGSSKPGDKVGAALIVGHVSGLTKGGVFYNLYRLTDGDEIIVEMGDGTKYTYKVVSKEEVPLDGINMNNYLISKNIDKPGLTLMTCAGEYNPVTQTYDNRLAVFAVRAD